MKIRKFKFPKSLFSQAFLDYLFRVESSIEILFGGAGSGKTVHSAFKDIIRVLSGKNVLVVKQVYGSLQDSYFSDLKKAIEVLGLSSQFTSKVSPLRLEHESGKVILFRGLDDVEKIKGITAPKGQIDHYTVEEITETHEESINQLQFRARGGGSKLTLEEIAEIRNTAESSHSLADIQSLKRKQDVFKMLGFDDREDFVDSKKTMTALFNPVYKEHWVFERFFTDEDDREIFQIEDKVFENHSLYIMHSDHWDNQFLTYDDHMKYEGYRFINPYYYEVYCRGNWGVLGDLIFTNWRVADLTKVAKSAKKVYFGLDFGYDPDPSALVAVTVVGTKIYILREVVSKRCNARQLYDMMHGLTGDSPVICDRDERVHDEMKALGMNMKMVSKRHKGMGSSNLYNIQWWLNYEIVIDYRCVEYIKEIKSYVRDKDANGKTLPTPVDGNDHSIQSAFYALNDYMEINQDVLVR